MWITFLLFLAVSAEAKTPPAQNQVDYEALNKECEQKLSSQCCLTSVERMKSHKVGPLLKGICPEGFEKNTLRCVNAFQWCEPVKVQK